VRTDLPQCGFQNCRNQFDGNCKDKTEYEMCAYRRAVQTLETIIKAQWLYVLYMEHGDVEGKECVPIWSGAVLGGES